MRLESPEHLKHDWWVHDYARDFELLDVWRYPIEGTEDEFDDFVRLHDVPSMVAESSVLVRFLFSLRSALGRVFGWDATKGDFDEVYEGDFGQVHRSERELVLRTENATVTALLHLGWAPLGPNRFTAQLAVYVIPKGLLGRCYMKLIGPFRHLLVYPALMKACRKRWEGRAPTRWTPVSTS